MCGATVTKRGDFTLTRKRRRTFDLLDYASDHGFQVRRRTSNGRSYVVRHKKTGATLTIPQFLPDIGSKQPNWLALIRREAKGPQNG